MKYFNKIEGDNLYLSPVNVDDCELYTKWINDLSVAVPLGNASQVFTIQKEKEEMEEFSKGGYNFAILLKENDQLIGNCSLFHMFDVHRNAEVGIWIGEEDCRGKGYGPEALRLILSYGFKVLNLHNIFLRVFSFNERAMKAYKKLGFREIGRRTEAYCINSHFYDVIFMEILDRDFECKYLDDVLPT